MVHALEKIYSLLKPEGILLNIQPDDQPRPIEIHGREGVREAGRSKHRQNFLPYKQAMAAVAGAVGNGAFVVEREETFSFLDEFDTVAEMEEYVAENWENSIMGEDVLQRARELEQEIEGDTKAVVNEGVLIQRLKRVDKEASRQVDK